jgi:hypothetical protein
MGLRESSFLGKSNAPNTESWLYTGGNMLQAG